MSLKDEKYQVENPDVIYRIIDGETVILNLAKGYYYNLRKTGSKIWEAIDNGLSRDQLLNQLFSRYDVDREEIIKSVTKFIEELKLEGLIMVKNGSPSSSVKAIPLKQEKNDNQREVFEIPTLEKYTDLQELLLLDPIHDVDAAGWPSGKKKKVKIKKSSK